VPQIALQRVIADVEEAASLPLVAAAALEDEAGIPAAPRPQGIVGGQRRPQDLTVHAADLRREIVELDPVAVDERNGPFHQPFELADVAGPLVGAQRVLDGRRDLEIAHLPVPGEKVAGQLGDVGLPAAQRRDVDFDAAQPVVEIGTEYPAGDERLERLVRRRDDARVDAAVAVAADPLDREILQRPQELGLRRQRQVGDLVEEERSPFGMLELAPASAHPRGRALFDPEELCLEQRLDHRRAVDGDEGAVPAAAQLVELPRHELLAGARLAFDEDREVGLRDTLDTIAQHLHHRGGSDQWHGDVDVGLAHRCGPA
jgi:hypothetical protein